MESTGEVWVLTPEAFDKLLLFLDSERDSAAEKYEVMHRKLIKFFEWRGHPQPEQLADETLNRVARKVSEGLEIRTPNPASFILGVARLVYLEGIRRLHREEVAARETAPLDQEPEEEDARLERLRRCMERLDEPSRRLLTDYYSLEGGEKIALRKKMAEDLGITVGVLRLRAHRLRQGLERCVGSSNAAA
jgi:DNA-directed RNA polymerase specialized sigma24 family protein